MKFTLTFLGFLAINLGALFLGTLLMNDGPTSSWYFDLEKAPWTPAGWVFGAAWTCVMVFFSVFISYLHQNLESRKLWFLFGIQFILNVSWNYIFMNKHLIDLGLLNITILTFLMFYFFIAFKDLIGYMRFFVLPYCVWLLLASSLNLYVVLYN